MCIFYKDKKKKGILQSSKVDSPKRYLNNLFKIKYFLSLESILLKKNAEARGDFRFVHTIPRERVGQNSKIEMRKEEAEKREAGLMP